MQDNAAVYRTQETLAEGKKLIDQTVQTFMKDVKVADKSLIWNTDLIETLELRNLLGEYVQDLYVYVLVYYAWWVEKGIVDLIFVIGDRNSNMSNSSFCFIGNAATTMHCAEARKESRGAHARSWNILMIE